MADMGRQKIVDKTIKPLEDIGALQTVGPLNVTEAIRNRIGYFPLGGYKGQTVFFDLDKLVNEPLVNAEKQHILGILDGRLPGRDLATIHIPDGQPAGAAARAQLIVPAGQVWFIHAVAVAHGADHTTGVVACNWRCSIWPSPEDPPDENGQAFHAVAKEGITGDALAFTDMFYTGAIGSAFTAAPPAATDVVLTNKDVSLRLPAGASITLTTLVTTPIDGDDVDVTLALYGYVGKRLVQ